jgi:hypothetical protein
MQSEKFSKFDKVFEPVQILGDFVPVGIKGELRIFKE